MGWIGTGKPPVEFETTPVDRGRIVARVTATGTLSALVTVQVGTQISGTVEKLYVDFNDTVKQFLDVVTRHRRSMLSLNTVIGQRVMP